MIRINFVLLDFYRVSTVSTTGFVYTVAERLVQKVYPNFGQHQLGKYLNTENNLWSLNKPFA